MHKKKPLQPAAEVRSRRKKTIRRTFLWAALGGLATMPLADGQVMPRPAALSVRSYRASDRNAWTGFVTACPDATFFHRIEWRDLIDGLFRHRTHYMVAERAGRIVAVLPLAEVKSLLFGHALVSLPFAEHAGVATMEPAAVAPQIGRAHV